jgi:hypothetical protein
MGTFSKDLVVELPLTIYHSASIIPPSLPAPVAVPSVLSQPQSNLKNNTDSFQDTQPGIGRFEMNRTEPVPVASKLLQKRSSMYLARSVSPTRSKFEHGTSPKRILPWSDDEEEDVLSDFETNKCIYPSTQKTMVPERFDSMNRSPPHQAYHAHQPNHSNHKHSSKMEKRLRGSQDTGKSLSHSDQQHRTLKGRHGYHQNIRESRYIEAPPVIREGTFLSWFHISTISNLHNLICSMYHYAPNHDQIKFLVNGDDSYDPFTVIDPS